MTGHCRAVIKMRLPARVESDPAPAVHRRRCSLWCPVRGLLP
jgi:hypothetical protein